MRLWIFVWLAVCLGIPHGVSATDRSVLTKNASRAGENTNDFLQQLVADKSIQGMSLSVLVNAQLVHQSSLGYRDREQEYKVDKNTAFQIASITKLFVSSAVLELLSEHEITVEAELGSILRDIPQSWHKVKLKHLLSHTSGLPDYYRKKTNPKSLEEALNLVKRDEFEYRTGRGVRYNQTAFALLHKVVEVLSKTSLENYLQTRQLDPLGLSNTYYHRAPTEHSNRAEMFQKSGKSNVPFDLKYTAALRGSAGLFSSNEDLTKWMKSFIEGRILPRALAERAWQPVTLQNGQPSRFGLGWEVMDMAKVTSVGHGGADTSEVRHYTHKDTGETVTVIWLSNTLGFYPGEAMNTIAGFYMQDMSRCSSFLFWHLDCADW